MRMSDFVIRDAILPALSATTKEGIIREIVQGLHRAGYFRAEELEDIVRLVMRREQIGSTGIGRGIAIPHTRHIGVDRLIGSLALAPGGVDFDAIDGEDVFVFVLLVSPQDRPGDHLRALENVVRVMRDDGFIRALRQAGSREAVWNLIDGAQPPWER